MKKYPRIKFICFVIGFIIITQIIFIFAIIPSESMEPTLSQNSIVIGNRLFQDENIQRGDILIFKSEDHGKLYIKRVIGLPGDIITIHNSVVYVNHQPIEEDYIKNPWTIYNNSYEFYVPSDSYFFLGDNRDHSYDSRLWKEPYINKEDIVATCLYP